ncbi:MAG: hypothetical protein AAF074_25110, partial [Pseudomonadota bacterium]
PDFLVGGDGNADVAVFRFNRADYTIDRSLEADGFLTVLDTATGEPNDGFDVLLEIEILRFADGDVVGIPSGTPNIPVPQTIEGTSDDDTLTGENGDETLFGRAGNDTLNGGAGDDTLDGGTGDDTVDGGEGDDRLIASTGVDRLSGGAGVDSFVFGEGSSALGGNIDRIADLTPGEDRIELPDATLGATPSIIASETVEDWLVGDPLQADITVQPSGAVLGPAGSAATFAAGSSADFSEIGAVTFFLESGPFDITGNDIADFDEGRGASTAEDFAALAQKRFDAVFGEGNFVAAVSSDNFGPVVRVTDFSPSETFTSAPAVATGPESLVRSDLIPGAGPRSLVFDEVEVLIDTDDSGTVSVSDTRFLVETDDVIAVKQVLTVSLVQAVAESLLLV